jgi:hypothetical protein
MIYFMQATDGGPVKIGYARDVKLRRQQLSSAYKRRMTILKTMEGGKEEETAMHERFAGARIRDTEQFRLDDNLLGFLEGCPVVIGPCEEMVLMNVPRQFRFTDDEIDRIDAVAKSLAEPGVPVSRITVLRIAIRELAERRLEGAKKQ